MASTTYNVGVIGYGMSAKTFHIPFILVVQSLKFYAIVQRNPTVDDNAATDYPGIKSYRTTEELVKDPAVDVVVITTVPESHFALTKLALEAGKHGAITTLGSLVVELTLDSDMRETVRSYCCRGGRANCYCKKILLPPLCVSKYVSELVS
jgi:hypothetical protein